MMTQLELHSSSIWIGQPWTAHFWPIILIINNSCSFPWGWGRTVINLVGQNMSIPNLHFQFLEASHYIIRAHSFSLLSEHLLYFTCSCPPFCGTVAALSESNLDCRAQGTSLKCSHALWVSSFQMICLCAVYIQGTARTFGKSERKLFCIHLSGARAGTEESRSNEFLGTRSSEFGNKGPCLSS